MVMASEEMTERVEEVLDELVRKLQTDPRMPTNPPLQLYEFDPQALGAEEPRQYPCMFFVTGQVDEGQIATAIREGIIVGRIEVYVSNRDPTAGTREIRQLIRTIRNVLIRKKQDVLLYKEGKALAQKILVPTWGWAYAGPSLREEGSTVFGGLLQFEVYIDVNEVL